jgi:hypothetical protein
VDLVLRIGKEERDDILQQVTRFSEAKVVARCTGQESKGLK